MKLSIKNRSSSFQKANCQSKIYLNTILKEKKFILMETEYRAYPQAGAARGRAFHSNLFLRRPTKKGFPFQFLTQAVFLFVCVNKKGSHLFITSHH